MRTRTRCSPRSCRPSPGPQLVKVTRQHDLVALAASVTLQAATADVWSHEVVSLTRAVRELAGSSLRRGADRVQIRFWNEPEVLVCDVTDDTMVEDLLIGTTQHASRHDSLWFANQACHLVQIRSSENGTTVRLHVRT